MEQGKFNGSKSFPAHTCGLLMLRYDGGNVIGVYAIDSYNATQLKQIDNATVTIDNNRIITVTTDNQLDMMYKLIALHN